MFRNKDSNKKTYRIFAWAISVGVVVSLGFEGRSEELRPAESFAGSKKLILLIIDDQSLFCPLCLEIFQNFCDLLRSSGQDAHAMGVLVYQVSDNDEEREGSEKIIEKRLRGLIIGSNICFPFLYDKFHIFEGLDLEGATIILFDRSRKLLKKYTLPLTHEQKEEVLSF